MRKKGIAAVLAMTVMAWGATTAEAAVLPELTQATNAEIKQAAPDFTKRQLRRAIVDAAEAGAKLRELKGPSPAWYDRKAQRRQNRDSRNDDGVTTAPVDAPIPPYVGIRPGAWMISPALICTMNYIFQKGGTLAIGTAGHCIDGGEPVDLLTVAPDGGGEPVPVLVRLGKVLLKRDGGIGNDYALVEIPPHLHSWVFPTQAVIAGPCGVYTENLPLPVAHYGHGLGIGTGGTPRAGMGLSFQPPKGFGSLQTEWDADSIFWAGAAMPGDSGSGVRVGQLPAVSNLTHGIGLGPKKGPAVPVPFVAWGTRVQTITASGWTLVNSLFCPPG